MWFSRLDHYLGGGYINAALLMMMMMMNSKESSDISLKIETYDDQTKTLEFSDYSDLRTFLQTDFEIIDVQVKDNADLVRVRELLRNQNVMDVDRKAYIKINQKIEQELNSEERRQDDSSPSSKVYDFNIHESDIRRI